MPVGFQRGPSRGYHPLRTIAFLEKTGNGSTAASNHSKMWSEEWSAESPPKSSNMSLPSWICFHRSAQSGQDDRALKLLQQLASAGCSLHNGGVRESVLSRVLHGGADANIRFADLQALLVDLRFSERIKGSHHIFTRSDVAEILNLQPRGSFAKPYQVKQVRKVIVRYKLEEGG